MAGARKGSIDLQSFQPVLGQSCVCTTGVPSRATFGFWHATLPSSGVPKSKPGSLQPRVMHISQLLGMSQTNWKSPSRFSWLRWTVRDISSWLNVTGIITKMIYRPILTCFGMRRPTGLNCLQRKWRGGHRETWSKAICRHLYRSTWMYAS